MATNEILNVILRLSTGDYKREAAEAASATSKIGDSATTASGGVGTLTTRAAAFGSAIKGMALAAAGAAVVKLGADSITAASNLEESINAVNKTFGTAASTIETFGQVSATAVGISTREFNQLATVTGSMLTNLGRDQAEAAAETIKLTQRASDMASVFNTDVGTALEAINSALKGEANPIEQFGVKLNDAAVRARAVEMGLADTTAAVDANAKATATLSLIYEQTNKTAGDFAQTSDGLANAQRRAAAAAENAQARLGKAVTPALAFLMDTAAEGVERLAAAFGDKAAKQSLVFNEAMKSVTDEMAAGTLGAEDLANAALHVAEFGDLTADQFDILASAVGLSTDQYVTFRDEIIRQAEEMGIPADIIAEIAGAIVGVNDAAAASPGPIDAMDQASRRGSEGARILGARSATSAGQIRDLIAANREYRSSLLEGVSPAAAALAALKRLKDAQKTLEDVQKDGTTTSEELAEAQLAVAEAVFEAQGALNTFDSSGVQLAIDAIAAALNISKQEAQLLLEQLGLIEGKEVTAVVNLVVNSDIPLGSLSDDQLNDLLGGSITGTTPQPRQHGGSVWGGVPYIVGERGRELFIPQSAGMVVPNVELQRMGGTKTVTINVASPMNEFRSDLQYATLLASVTNLVEAG